MKGIWRALRPLLRVLPAGSRRFLIVFGSLSALLSVLDLAAFALVGVLLQAFVSGESHSFPGLGSLNTANAQITVLIVVCVVILAKGGLAVLLLHTATKRFAAHEVAIGDRLLDAYVKAPWKDRLAKNSSALVRSVDMGVGLAVSGVLIPSMTLFGELGTMLATAVALTVFNPAVALASIAFLGLVVLVLAKLLSPRSVAAGRQNRKYSNMTVRVLSEMLAALKEITLADRTKDVQEHVHSIRVHSAQARARSSYYGQVPRYVLETALVIGFGVVGGIGYLTGGTDGAVTSLGMFSVAGFRLVPSLTRMQAIQSQVNSNAPFARGVVDDITNGERQLAEAAHEVTQHDLAAERPDIHFDDVTFAYSPDAEPALAHVSLTIPAGAHVAFVGSSGAGKSTLVDLLLGLLTPQEGSIVVGGEELPTVLRSWQSRIGYVPQDVSLFDATIAENVALTWVPEHVDRDRARAALERAQLWDVVASRPDGLDAVAGERGTALSGGQRQRLGIARALYESPRVLVMDEATSALDTATEAAVTEAVSGLRGEVTVITVAHRLATIRDCDIVYYLHDGGLEASGTFDEVVAAVPDFARQAKLAGL